MYLKVEESAGRGRTRHDSCPPPPRHQSFCRHIKKMKQSRNTPTPRGMGLKGNGPATRSGDRGVTEGSPSRSTATDGISALETTAGKRVATAALRVLKCFTPWCASPEFPPPQCAWGASCRFRLLWALFLRFCAVLLVRAGGPALRLVVCLFLLLGPAFS